MIGSYPRLPFVSPVILHQRRWFRGTWSKRDGNVNNEEKRRGIRKVYMVKKTGTDGTSQKSRDRLSKSVITNWKMKKSVCAVENIDRNRQTTKNSIEVINNTVKNTMRRSDTEEDIKWNKN